MNIKKMIEGILPVLTCEEASKLEESLLQSDETRVWAAMSSVGNLLGAAITRDYLEIGVFPEAPKILVLLGKGHNSGDALLAAANIRARYPKSQVDLFYCLGNNHLRPLVVRARALLHDFQEVTLESLMQTAYDLCIDGVFGMSFQPPVREGLLEVFKKINAHEKMSFRAAVDVPSGGVLRADFTYATGVVKAPLFQSDFAENVGRIRFLDIGFFDQPYVGSHSQGSFILTEQVLAPLRRLRKSLSNKRTYGHLLMVSGSKQYPGALLMSIKAALKGGVGLLTVFAPESIALPLAVEVPEAMWVPCPETSSGSLSLGAERLFFDQCGKGQAVVCGPGIGQDPESLELVKNIVARSTLPFVLDASALVASTFEGVKQRASSAGPVIATPHLGEFQRIAEGQSIERWHEAFGVTTLLKGPIARIMHQNVSCYSTFGGPVLARGGSGDVLSGLIGALLVQTPEDPLTALAQAVVWQGLAADALARDHGSVSVRTTDILDYLEPVLRKNII